MLLLLAACTARPAPESVVLVTWDTVSAQHMAMYGGAARTPTLDALAARGTRYDQAITPLPETVYAHWSLFTGVEPALHGPVPQNHDSTWTGPTTAERLRAAGYATGAFIGGITLEARLTGLARGFDLYDDAGDPRREPKRDGDAVVDAALLWIGAQRQPFFAFVHLFDAHLPYDTVAPQVCDPSYQGPADGSMAFLSSYQGFSPPAPPLPPEDLAHIARLYDCEIERLDTITGRLVDSLPSGTRVIVVADHGESFSGGYFFNHRRSLDDEVLRVPLVVSRSDGARPEGEPAVIPWQVNLTSVDGLVRGEPARPSPEVITILDPWGQPGRLRVRRLRPDGAVESATWALTEGDALTTSELPAQNYTIELLNGLSDYKNHNAALQDQVRTLRPVEGLDHQTTNQLRELGYLDGGGPSEPPGAASPIR